MKRNTLVVCSFGLVIIATVFAEGVIAWKLMAMAAIYAILANAYREER